MPTFKEISFILNLDISKFFTSAKEAEAQIQASANLLKQSVQGSQQEIDALREYQFRSNRLTAQDYLTYLQTRLSSLRQSTAQEQQEYARIEDKIKEVQRQAERPLRLTSNIESLLAGFAKVGLAIDGLRQSYNLLINPIKESIRLSNQQEQADIKLIASLSSVNQLTEENVALLKEQASAMQSLTLSEDDQIQTLQALALNMGVTLDKIEETIEGAVGLAVSFREAGLSQETALKGIALAYQGNFELLGRYIPALRDAGDETRRMAILQEAMRIGFEQAKAETKSQAGEMQQLGIIVGDTKEIIGDLVKDALIPFVRIARPILEALNGMDAGTRNATIGFVAFVAAAIKVRTSIEGLRVAFEAMKLSIGPTGILLVGISAAATALGIYAASADDAADSNVDLEASNVDVAESFGKVTAAALSEFQDLSTDALILKRQELVKTIDQQFETLKKLNVEKEKSNQIDSAAIDFSEIVPDFTELQSNFTKASSDFTETISDTNKDLVESQISVNEERLRIINVLIEDSKNAQGELTETELEELDKRRAYQFQSNRISLTEYVAYLESRQEAVKTKFGQENAEYLKFIDNITVLRNQLQDQRIEGLLPDELEVREQATKIFDVIAEMYINLREIQIGFSEDSFSDLQSQFETRLQLSDLNLQIIEQTVGRETQLYRDELKKREQLERSYQNAKVVLAEKAALATIETGTQLMQVFQEENRVLFDIGKALSIAQVTIDAYQAAARAFKDYPFPFNVGISAIQFALAYGQVKKIEAVNFKPSGKAKGGLITEADIMQSIFTPPGESGLIGVQTFETIMNRGATKMFYPSLKQMNEIGLGKAPAPQSSRDKVPGYQEGGLVTNPAAVINQPAVDPGFFATVIEDAIYNAFRRSTLKVDGQLTGRGKDLQAVLDKNAELKSQL